ncbi:C-type lectin lectoxin-Phi1-like [Rhineura floridana]|uniref:C-type lectin lectoxin-Phi1-like n=1 Tax=Rhineura floridana TaxID=261503 RepID=UPI002AC85C71|nr:C-type lectin lectoxin-Phi1-like [Rhineura floridana]
MLCLVLFFAALGSIILYIQESKTTSTLLKAFKTIKDFIIIKEPSLKGKNDSEIFRETQKLADELVGWISKVNEIQAAIDDIKKKLHLQWVPYKETLYLFEDRVKPWHRATKFCESEKSVLISIESLEEEEFLEKEINFAHQDSWIGLHYSKGKWRWYEGVNVGSTFWKTGQPNNLDHELCVVLKAYCSSPRKCWDNIPCDKEKRWICKKKPDKRWYT